MKSNLNIIKLVLVLSIILLAVLLTSCGGGGEVSPPSPDTTPPFIISVSPSDGEIGIFVVPTVSVTFSEPVNRSLAQAAFSLLDDGTPVDGTFSWSGNIMIFDLGGELSDFAIYNVKVLCTLVADTSSNCMTSDFTSNFTTGPDTNPTTITGVDHIDLAIDVSISTNVSIVFSDSWIIIIL